MALLSNLKKMVKISVLHVILTKLQRNGIIQIITKTAIRIMLQQDIYLGFESIRDQRSSTRLMSRINHR